VCRRHLQSLVPVKGAPGRTNRRSGQLRAAGQRRGLLGLNAASSASGRGHRPRRRDVGPGYGRQQRRWQCQLSDNRAGSTRHALPSSATHPSGIAGYAGDHQRVAERSDRPVTRGSLASFPDASRSSAGTGSAPGGGTIRPSGPPRAARGPDPAHGGRPHVPAPGGARQGASYTPPRAGPAPAGRHRARGFRRGRDPVPISFALTLAPAFALLTTGADDSPRWRLVINLG
jgi:hypothetical protein